MIQLNLGCGADKRDGYINIDKRVEVEPDQLLDIELRGLSHWEDNSVDRIIAKDFLEHIRRRKVIFVMEEIWRVLKDGAEFEHFTPSSCGRGAFQDPTHRSYWNYNSWLYYTDDAYRELIGTKAKFEVVGMNDVLTSDVAQIIHTHGVLTKVGDSHE